MRTSSSLFLAVSLLGCGANIDDGSGPTTASTGGGGATGTGGATQGTGGATQGTGGATQGTGGATQGKGGATQGKGGGMQGTGGGMQGTGGAAQGSGGASQGTAGTSADLWRPFSADSPWNTPIGDSPVLDPNSAALATDFKNSSPYGSHLDVNITGFSIPVYWADASTPKTKVTCRLGGHGFTSTNGSNATAMVPIPAGAAPDPQSDHHLLIVDRATNTEYGMWDTAVSGGTWTCGLGATLDLLGKGVRPIAKDANPWWEAHGPRACGYGLANGLIRPDEIRAGRIDHALVVAYPHVQAGMYVPPASTAQAANGQGALKGRGIPCGGRIQFDPSIDVTALGVTGAGQTILRALQVYGAYVGDFSGAISLYADNSPDAQTYWQSIGFDCYELKDKIDLGAFRVMEIGTMYDNGNG